MENRITIQNIQEYTQQIRNGNLVLTRIIPIVDEEILFTKKLRGSNIIECKINNQKYEITKYKKLLIYLYENTDLKTILSQPFNYLKTQQEIYEKGFEYYNHLGVSIQITDTRRTLKEIISIIKIKNFSMELKIKLKNDEMIRFII